MVNQIPGWFDSHALYEDMVQNAPENAVFVEVGCFFGASSIFMGNLIRQSGKDIKLHCIDIWESCFHGRPATRYFSACTPKQQVRLRNIYEDIVVRYGNENPYSVFQDNVKKFKLEDIIIPRKCRSSEAAASFSDDSINFVFLDGDHSAKEVLSDISCWLPKVASGGVLAGDDYGWESVKAIVDRLFPQARIQKNLTGHLIWMVKKQP